LLVRVRLRDVPLEELASLGGQVIRIGMGHELERGALPVEEASGRRPAEHFTITQALHLVDDFPELPHLAQLLQEPLHFLEELEELALELRDTRTDAGTGSTDLDGRTGAGGGHRSPSGDPPSSKRGQPLADQADDEFGDRLDEELDEHVDEV